ncbi:hypothetical protein CspHIS471_0411580 [Cutaneotrichosporon sp. HIS471]|nr:hypothetical protein CspHIS471_0411580 [Cutaneotrichosporon sp. HIS471]
MTEINPADAHAPVAPPAYEEHAQRIQPSPEVTRVRQRHTEASGVPEGTGRATGTVAQRAGRQVRGVTSMAADAVTSGAWAYPLRGALYILTHPTLIGPVLPLLLRALLTSAGVVAACFFFLYLPQVAWLALFTGPLAFMGAIPLVLGEAYIILMFLGKSFLLGQLHVDLFDAVLVQKGHSALVQHQRPVTTKSSGVRQLGKLLSRPLSKLSTDNLVRYLLTLPLNLIPLMGPVFFLGYNGYKSGPSAHARYFQLKGWDKTRRANFIDRRRGAYTAFGMVSLLFNMVPIVGVILGLSSTVGAALWASELEGSAPTQDQEVAVSIPAR